MNEEIELGHLRYFLAWRRRFISARRPSAWGLPTLSQQIERIEQLLGHRLFDRTTRGVKLTLAGQLLSERARSTIEKVHDDLAQVRRLACVASVSIPGAVYREVHAACRTTVDPFLTRATVIRGFTVRGATALLSRRGSSRIMEVA